MSGKITFGSENVTSLYVGTQKVKKIYAGSELVYESTPPLPQKGDIIQIVDNGNTNRFKVLDIQGNIAKLLGMVTISSKLNNYNDDYYYFGGLADTALNTTYYNTFSNTFKNAIQPTTIYQRGVIISSSPSSNSYCFVKTNNEAQYIECVEDQYDVSDTRNIFLMSFKDVADYYGATTSMTPQDTTLIANTVATLCNTPTFLMRDKLFTGSTEYVVLFNFLKIFTQGGTGNASNCPPVLYLDLTNIPYTIE